VIKVSEFKLYELAIAVHPLTTVPEHAKYSDVWYAWFTARTELQTLFHHRQLNFCYEAANKLYNAITVVVPTEWQEAFDKLLGLTNQQDTPEPELQFIQRHNTVEAAKEFETVLRTELNNANTYFIDPKGAHDTSALLVNASAHIPKHILLEVKEIEQDIDQAGRCLLFDNSTAVGFHLMRAIETVIYKYLKNLSGKDTPVKSRSWGVYIKALKKLNAEKKVIGTIEHIKDTYRNPILHPEVSLTPDDAQVLFGLAVSAIVQIVGVMKATKGATIAFPATGTIALP